MSLGDINTVTDVKHGSIVGVVGSGFNSKSHLRL
jgi:hypothetical protein